MSTLKGDNPRFAFLFCTISVLWRLLCLQNFKTLFFSLCGLILVTAMCRTVPENILSPLLHPGRATEIPRGWGGGGSSKRRQFRGSGGLLQRSFSRGSEWDWWVINKLQFCWESYQVFYCYRCFKKCIIICLHWSTFTYVGLTTFFYSVWVDLGSWKTAHILLPWANILVYVRSKWHVLTEMKYWMFTR